MVLVKRAFIFVMLAVFLVSVTFPTASAAIMGSWVPSISTVRTTSATKPFSSVIEAVAKFEGTLQAYSVSGDQNVEEQVFLASDGVSSSLESLNAELTEIYSSLDKVQQDAIVEAYLSMGSYLVDLSDEANQIFQGEDEKPMANFEYQVDIEEKSVNKFGGYWIGFTLGEPPK
jgi:hypothetical protein